MTEVTQQGNQGNITLEDVRAALAGTDPNQTNAGAIRAILGRGSNKTIQTHLDKIRAELMPQPLQATGEAPNAPKELVQSLWSSAWQSAQLQTASALAAALAKLAVTEQALSVARSDSEDAQGAADIAVAALASVTDLQAKAAAAAAAAVQELATVKAEASLQAERAAAAAALQEAKHLAAVELMRSEMDRLVNQLADLRAGLRWDKGE